MRLISCRLFLYYTVTTKNIQQYFPEVVSENEDGYLSLDYAKLTSVIFRVLKDIIDRLSKLENK